MKKLLVMLALIVALSFSVTACGEKNNIVEETANINKEAEANEENAVVEEDEVVVEEEQTEEMSLDISLVGRELLASLSMEEPKSMKIEAETESFGTIYKSIYYYDGENTRVESFYPDMGTGIVISLAQENATYTYTEGATEGVKMIGESLADEDMGVSVDSASAFDGILADTDENFTAKVDTLNGEQVIYIETKDMDEDMGEVTVKMWFSVKYGVPLRYEAVAGAETMAVYTVTNIEVDLDLDKSLFEAPSGVTFQEVDLESMMGDW